MIRNQTNGVRLGDLHCSFPTQSTTKQRTRTTFLIWALLYVSSLLYTRSPVVEGASGHYVAKLPLRSISEVNFSLITHFLFKSVPFSMPFLGNTLYTRFGQRQAIYNARPLAMVVTKVVVLTDLPERTFVSAQ